MYLILIETSGNQNYIFSTNKLKENIGASELTYLAGTKWVLNAVAEINHTPKMSLWTGTGNNQLREKILNLQINKPIEDDEGIRVEVIIATSGKSLILARKREDAQRIIQYVTHQALIEAPGLDICGVVEEFCWENDKLGDVNRRIHQKFEEAHSKKPSPALRFLRLPVVAECSTSGLPACTSKEDREGNLVFKSFVSDQKTCYRKKALERFKDFLEEEGIDIDFIASIRALNEELFEEDIGTITDNITYREFKREWLAVVHADGNGLGKIFLNFGNYINDSESIKDYNREYVKQYRNFSLALDLCTERAFLEALKALPSLARSHEKQSKIIPLFPLVMGGDDLTIVCDGKYALQFTRIFLQEFEKNTENLDNLPEGLRHLKGVIPAITKESSLKTNRLSACAGISIIKPHFPFYIAYKLAEDLILSAKKVKDKVKKECKTYPCSAFDFHVVYDTSGVDLNKIREKLFLDSKHTKLYGRPYIVTPENQLTELDEESQEWIKYRRWEILEKQIESLKVRDKNDKQKLPNSQMHELREGLFLGKNGADARLRLIVNRYKPEILEITKDRQGETLFWQEQEESKTIYVTGFLDAMDAVDFFRREP